LHAIPRYDGINVERVSYRLRGSEYVFREKHATAESAAR
jgi:hypothetical protein